MKALQKVHGYLIVVTILLAVPAFGKTPGRFANDRYSLQGEFIDKTFKVDGTFRSYKLYVPTEYDGQEDWPLVISFHGFSLNNDPSSSRGQPDIDGFAKVADTAHFLIAYPLGLAITVQALGGTDLGWNTNGGFGEWDDVAFTEKLIDHIDKDYAVDLRKVYATGFSFGSMMAFTLACSLSDRIAAVGGVAGPLVEKFFTEGCPASRPVAILLMHETTDPVIPFSGFNSNNLAPRRIPETASFWARHNGCSVDSVVTALPDNNKSDGCSATLVTYTNCESNTEVNFYRIENGGHSWPNTSNQFLQQLGNVNKDIDGSKLIWDFFVRNPHPNPTSIETGSIVDMPKEMRLYQNYPNPFNPSTKINYSISELSFVTLKIFDLLGREVATLVDEEKSSGNYEFNFSADNLTSGIYFYQLKTKNYTQSKKMLLLI